MKTALIFLLFLTCSWAQAQSGKWRYNPQGQLVDGKGQLANAHQEMHDMSNPSLYTTGAVAVSNTIDPNFAQANLATIEAVIDPNAGQGGRSMSRLYLTPSNPYTPGAGVQSGAPVGFNSDHYDKILLDASSSGYKPTQSGAYMAKTHENSSASLFNRGFHTYEANTKFLAAKEAAGGQGGGIVFMINQSGESFAHLQAISGSNMFMSAYGRMQDGSVFRLGGQVVLNQKHNKSADLNTSMFGPAFVAGVHEANRRMASTGNEQGFWVTGTGDQTQIQGWGDGSAQSISAAYNPNARFHVHTHPNNTGPSHADMFASAFLGGMPGMVVAANGGQFAYGFQLEAGQIKRSDGQVITFEQSLNINMGGFSIKAGVHPNSDASTTIAASVGYPGGGFTNSVNTGVELSAATFRAGMTSLALLGLAGGPPGFVGAEIVAQSISNQYRDFAYDSRVTHSVETSFALGTFGGADPSKAYHDGAGVYGGLDGNTAPDGSAINGF